MRLGGPVFGQHADPDAWAKAVRGQGYGAAYCPVDAAAGSDVVKAYADAARRADVVIAEVGAWSNPLSQDAETRSKALENCKRQLDLADRIGARCCVNIAGSRAEQWDGPHPDNLTPKTFDLVVDMVREIVDAVKPRRTYYTLETMPWMYPDSPESYAALVKAIDRKQFGVHLDPVNLVCSPQRYYSNGALIRQCFELLGPWIRSCHAKDIALAPRLTTHLDEVRPGLGGLDYKTFLECASRRDPDLPVMLEHLSAEEDYKQAAAHIRSVAAAAGVTLR